MRKRKAEETDEYGDASPNSKEDSEMKKMKTSSSPAQEKMKTSSSPIQEKNNKVRNMTEFQVIELLKQKMAICNLV